MKRKHLTEEQRKEIVDMWLSGLGKVKEVAKLTGCPTSTVYSTLYRAGVWPGYDDYRVGLRMAAMQLPDPAPVMVKPGTIQVMRRRGLWQRIKDFFA